MKTGGRAKAKPRSRSEKQHAPERTGVQRWFRGERLSDLHQKLREAQETLDAIRNGEVDAVVVNGAHGKQVYSLTGAEQPYRVYVEQMQEGAVTVSPDGLVLYCNRRLAEMLNVPLEQAISSKMAKYLSDDAWKRIAKVFQNSSGVVKHETMLRCRDGSELPVHLTASRLPMEEKGLMCLVVTDLTAQKEEAKLRLAKELAEKANATKDAFLAALSHELRTPLTPVLMSAWAMETDEELPTRVRREISMIRRNIELEARLIDDLLDLTRIARGKLELQVGAMDFHSVLRQSIEICRPDSEAKELTVQLSLRAKQTRTEGDAIRLQQAIWNLLRNAVKFTPRGGSIMIRTSNDQQDHIVLEVQDTGIGFDAHTRNRLFEAFEQGNRSITQRFGGLGLGLAITQSIVESHGGSVRGESKGPGRGATFILQLPLRPASPDTGTWVPHSASPVAERIGLRLLLVEDHVDTRRSMEFLLARHRHVVKSAASAREALELAANNKLDLVISDLGLPDQNGLELMKQLRDRFGLKGIGVSGYGMEEDIAKSRAAGFVCHLTKPISMDRLRQAIADSAKA